MKIRNFFLGALFYTVLFSVTGCDKLDSMNGDNKTNFKGKTGMMTVNFGGSTHKTRAWVDGPLESYVTENGIRNFTLWVLDNNDNVAASFYFEGSEVKQSFSLVIPLSSNKAVVIANEGDRRNATITNYDDIKNLTAKIGVVDFGTYNVDDPVGTEYLGNLGQSGEKDFIWDNGSVDVTIQLTYIPARISLTEVTLFGENVSQSGELTEEGIEKMTAAGISDISISTIYIINAKDDTYLLDQGGENGLVYTNNYYYGYGTKFTTGIYYPDVQDYSNNENANFWSNAPGNSDKYPVINSERYPIFYVAENKDTGTPPGLTCVVIMCSVTFPVTPETTETKTLYYTIPLNATNTGVEGYSTKRGHHYIITADISSIGSTNPYNPKKDYGTFTWTITPSGWNEINPGGMILPSNRQT